MEVFNIDDINEWFGFSIDESFWDSFITVNGEIDDHRNMVFKRFRDNFNRGKIKPISQAGVLMKPAIKQQGKENSWVCSSCGHFLGKHYVPNKGTESFFSYCPGCGKAIDWPEGTWTMEPSYVESGYVYAILKDMEASEDPVEQELCSLATEKLKGKALPYQVNGQKAPIKETEEGYALVDGLEKEDGTIYNGPLSAQLSYYSCPVCSWFVDSQDLPMFHQLFHELKTPSKYCPRCGQHIDWRGIELDPDVYDLDAIKE